MMALVDLFFSVATASVTSLDQSLLEVNLTVSGCDTAGRCERGRQVPADVSKSLPCSCIWANKRLRDHMS